MRFCFYIILIFINNYSYSSQWICKEEVLKIIEDTYELCGIGEGSYRDTAIINSLKNIFERFDLVCNNSYDCKENHKEIEILPSHCEKNSEDKIICYRYVYITVNKLNFFEKFFNKFFNQNNTEYLINNQDYEEIKTHTAPKLENLRKGSEKIYINEKDVVVKDVLVKDIVAKGFNNTVKILNIKTKKPVSGIIITLYQNGSIGEIASSKNGFLDGFTRTYHQNGKIKSELFYKKGIAYGMARLFHENGLIQCITDLNNRKKCYYDRGELEAEYLIKNGTIDGDYKRYNKYEILIEKGKHCSGERCGIFQTFYDSGKLKQELEYINGKKQGESNIYLENGKFCATFIYKNGILISGKASTGRKLHYTELYDSQESIDLQKVSCR